MPDDPNPKPPPSPPTDAGPKPVRKEAIFTGRVQGVGFRATTQAVATRFAVAGFVRNLPDGTVQVTAEGTEAEVTRFLAAVQNELAWTIATMKTRPTRDGGKLRGFQVRY
ncbi:MAG: acylphosphatase [Phycisphaerae bacterium]